MGAPLKCKDCGCHWYGVIPSCCPDCGSDEIKIDVPKKRKGTSQRSFGGFMSPTGDDDRQRQQERDARRRAEVERLVYIRLVQQTNRRLEMLMKTMDQVLEEVYVQRGQIESLAALTSGIKEKLNAAINSAGAITPSQQAQIDKVFDELEKNRAAIVKAINANDDDPSNDEKPAESPKAPALTPTSISVASSKNPSDDGERVTFTASLNGGSGMTGTVVFYADDKVIGETTPDSTGVVAIGVNPPAGEHDITASYSGDAVYAPSESAEFTQVVNAAVEQPAAPAEPAPTEDRLPPVAIDTQPAAVDENQGAG